MKREFLSSTVSYHFDGPKQIYQISVKGPYQWLTSCKTEAEARRTTKLIAQLLKMHNGANIVHHLYSTIKDN